MIIQATRSDTPLPIKCLLTNFDIRAHSRLGPAEKAKVRHKPELRIVSLYPPCVTENLHVLRPLFSIERIMDAFRYLHLRFE